MVKRKDLVDISDSDWPQRQYEYIKCLDCDFIIGGTQGDYWQESMDYIFVCSDCGSENLAIVRDKTEQIIIKQ